MKKSKTIVLIITPILSTMLFSNCNKRESYVTTRESDVTTREPNSTRDVYQNRNDCIKDWGEQNLCEQMNDSDSDDYRRNGGVYTGGRPIWGPRYYPSDRTVIYQNRTISPTGRTTTMTPYIVTEHSSSSSRSSVSSPRSSSTTYGGFGEKSSSSTSTSSSRSTTSSSSSSTSSSRSSSSSSGS